MLIIGHLLLPFAMLFSLSVSAIPLKKSNVEKDILAYWIDSQHMLVQVPSNVIPRNSLSFFLRDQATPAGNNQQLPILSYNHDWIVLNTSVISKAQQRDLVSRSLVLDVMSGTFLMYRTGVALTSILDDLFYTDSTLGQIWKANEVEIKIWSPTARQMIIHVYASANAQVPVLSEKMQVDSGIWSYSLPRSYTGYYYKLEVKNFFPNLQNYVDVWVTDPYSPSVSEDGERTLLIDLEDPTTKPAGWETYSLPAPVKTIDSVIYESHIRDLTAADKFVSPALRGKYAALAIPDTSASRHLKSLKNAGLTHLHLLPFNDFATVPENEKEQQALPDRDWHAPDEAPTALARIRETDNYNWGYDPVHWLSPEGSYATDANGISRVLETRKMIMALHRMGLHVTQDVVFNHTYAADFSEKSVLNKLVPFYYYRLESKGLIANSSCCADTASENRMMEKLMNDSLIHWIKHYHITSFRFDLMSFHSRETMVRLRENIKDTLQEVFSVPTDSVLIYGEAWPFGSLNAKSPNTAMTQKNSFGGGIGVFNDRFRDALRGGTTNLAEPSDQGYITGLLDRFNFSPRNRNSPVSYSDRSEKFLHLKDVVKIGLAGNLRDFRFTEHWGSHQTGGSIHYRGSPVAYAQAPQETINYVSAHDGTTLWDAIQAKSAYQSEWAAPPTTELWERVRRHQLALSFVLFSQGIPFIEGGTEILRSKNGDIDSYDSGDYYNALDFSLKSNNWNRALPPEWKNGSEWSFWSARIIDRTLAPRPEDISATLNLFKAMLEIRKNFVVFRMNNLAEIQKQLEFLDNPSDTSVLAMRLTANDGKPLLVIWNVASEARNWPHPYLRNSNWKTVPQLNSHNTPWFSEVEIHDGLVHLPALSFVVLKQGKNLK